jgi:ribosomal-protein-alanine N-acetyltransferase
MQTPVLMTKRILLHPLSVDDAQACFDGWTGDPDVARYMSWSTHKSIADTLNWLAMEELQLEGNDVYDWGFVLRATGELFGSGGLTYNAERRMYEIGYCIMKKYWNMGLTTEAAGRIAAFARETLDAKVLFGRHAKQNPASGRVLEHTGFIYTGDGTHASFDGTKKYETREYLLTFSE